MDRLKVWKQVARAVKWIFHLCRSHVPRVVLYAIIVWLKTFLELYITYKVGSLVDYLLVDDLHKLIRAAVMFGTLYFANIVISFGINRFNAWNYNRMQKDMFMKIYAKVLQSDWESLTLHSSGDLLARISGDVKTAAGNANGLLPTIFSQITTLAGGAAVIIYFDPSILVVVAVLIPFVLFAMRIFMRKQYQTQQEIRRVESEIMSFNKETFHNMQAVKAFGLFEVFRNKMQQKADRLLRIDMKSNWYSMLSWSVTAFAGLISVGCCGAWIVYRMHSNVLSFGNVASMAAIAVTMASAASGLVKLIPVVIEFTTSTERLRELMELPDERGYVEIEEKEELIQEISKQKLSVAIRDMSFHYQNGSNVFEKVSLHADAGEIVALVGPSGEGKTTMLRIILGIITAQEGEALVNGNESTSLSLGPATRSLIAYVPQGNTMMAGTIAENMRMIAPDATDEQIVEALKTACAYDFVAKLPNGIQHMIGESGLGFSEGQNQRLAIARAILRDTPILLLDEATSALDVVTERKVLANIMKKDTDRICILTTHRPSVLSMCNRVYRISNKKIAAIGEEEIRKLMDEF